MSEQTSFVQRWGDDAFTQRGFTMFPNAVLEHAAELGIGPQEGWMLCHILYFKRNTDHPRPSLSTLAQRLGKSPDSVRRYLRSLEKRGLLRIEASYTENGGQATNVLDFTPLREHVNKLLDTPLADLQGAPLADLQAQDSESSRTEGSPSRGTCTSNSETTPTASRSASREPFPAAIAQVIDELIDLAPSENRLSLETFLARYDVEVVEGAWHSVRERMKRDGDLESPGAYLYAVVQAREEAKRSDDLEAKEKDEFLRRAAAGMARSLLVDWDEDMARAILLDSFHDESLVDEALAQVQGAG